MYFKYRKFDDIKMYCPLLKKDEYKKKKNGTDVTWDEIDTSESEKVQRRK